MEQLVTALFLLFFSVEFLVELTLNELNLRHVERRAKAQNLPALLARRISPEDYEKSVAYTLARGKFERYSEIYGRLVVLGVLFGGVLPAIDRLAEWIQKAYIPLPYADGILFCFLAAAISSLANLPFSLYHTFVLETRFGFNKITWKLYVADRLKGLVLGLLIGVPFLLILFWLIDRAGPHWWAWGFLFIASFQFLMIVVYPVIIAPWFNKFEPLPAGELRDRIMTMAEKIGFRTSGIYTMDGSRRSGHSNAYFTGIGKAKRIVLFDTLIDQMTPDQGLAVLAHEIGHYKLRHIQRMLIFQLLSLFIGLYLLGRLVDFPPVYSAFGLMPSSHAALVLFSFLAGPATFYIAPMFNRLSRRHEYEADRFAVMTLGNAAALEEALIQLTVKNLSNLTPHPWYSAYHYSHPATTERIGALRSH